MSCIPNVADAPVHWLRPHETASATMLLTWAGEAHSVGAGVLLPRPISDLPPTASVALVHGTNAEEAPQAAIWAERHNAFTCWQIEPALHDPVTWDAVLRSTGPRLAHVRLLGSGPEAEGDASGSSGTGMLLSRLALRGYDGTVALVPSSSKYHDLWEHWLLTGRGWGCGTAAEKLARASLRKSTTSP